MLVVDTINFPVNAAARIEEAECLDSLFRDIHFSGCQQFTFFKRKVTSDNVVARLLITDNRYSVESHAGAKCAMEFESYRFVRFIRNYAWFDFSVNVPILTPECTK